MQCTVSSMSISGSIALVPNVPFTSSNILTSIFQITGNYIFTVGLDGQAGGIAIRFGDYDAWIDPVWVSCCGDGLP